MLSTPRTVVVTDSSTGDSVVFHSPTVAEIEAEVTAWFADSLWLDDITHTRCIAEIKALAEALADGLDPSGPADTLGLLVEPTTPHDV